MINYVGYLFNQAAGRLSADVRILPELELGPPFYDDRLASLDCLRIIPTNETESKRQNKITRIESMLTQWPGWVYHQYDARRLVIKIHNYLRFIRSSMFFFFCFEI